MILHIAERRRWDQAIEEGTYRSESLASEGFIHCSRAPQLCAVADRHFRGRTGLVLLAIDPELLAAPLRYEGAPGGALYPHIYGPLNLDAVLWLCAFAPEPDGGFRLPTLISGSVLLGRQRDEQRP